MKALSRYLDPGVIARIGAFELDPKGLVEGSQAGAHKSPFHGFSVEFAGHREYLPGDDTKHIDWVVYYKRERYMIKQYEAETNMVAQVLLDVSESMKFSSHGVSKKDYAAYLAVSLAYLVTKVRDKVGFGIFDSQMRSYLPPSNSLHAVYKIISVIEESAFDNKSDISRPMMEFANVCRRREMVFLISDFLSDPQKLAEGLARLRFDKHEVVVFHVVDPFEIDFPLEGRVNFKGLEGMGNLVMTPRQVRKAYVEKARQHREKLREICERGNAEYILADTRHPVKELLFSYLTSRLSHISR